MFVACGIWCLADVSSVSPSSEQTTNFGCNTFCRFELCPFLCERLVFGLILDVLKYFANISALQKTLTRRVLFLACFSCLFLYIFGLFKILGQSGFISRSDLQWA